MKIRVPYLIQDPRIIASSVLEPIEKYTFESEVFCLDGPVTRRVAVLDFDESTGDLRPGVRFLQPSEEQKYGAYELADENDFTAVNFMPVNVFTTVLSTLYMYQEKDVLGREVDWAFDAPQLLVIPRAGEWANAFYERESHSLQLFHFPAADGTVFTGLSQEIIAHETAHAILDGIAPDLYNCITPQSLALHEAVADLTALLVALRSAQLRRRLLDKTMGDISGSNAYSQLAEEFGYARDHTGRSRHLRSLWNERNLNPKDDSLDEQNQPNQVSRDEPHLLSEVLSGALYRVFARLHDEYKSKFAAEENTTEFAASGKALYVAGEHFKRLVLRSLDYLPPGEVSFTDYGRAILASDKASYQYNSTGRDKLVDEFVRRHIVTDSKKLDVQTNFDHSATEGLDFEILCSSDWAAYNFANRSRKFLGIPANVHFRVRDRLRSKKVYWTNDGPREVEELIFKVSWDREEDNPEGLQLTKRRQITVGTTLVLDWKTHQVRALLKSDATLPIRRRAYRQQRDDRNDMLRTLIQSHRLTYGLESDEMPHFGAAARVEVSGDLMRVRGSGRMLHLTQGSE